MMKNGTEETWASRILTSKPFESSESDTIWLSNTSIPVLNNDKNITSPLKCFQNSGM